MIPLLVRKLTKIVGRGKRGEREGAENEKIAYRDGNLYSYLTVRRTGPFSGK